MIIKRLQPGRYLAGLTFCWGVVATFSSFVQSFGALVACRLLLGLFEAGFFPGVVLVRTLPFSSLEKSELFLFNLLETVND